MFFRDDYYDHHQKHGVDNVGNHHGQHGGYDVQKYHQQHPPPYYSRPYYDNYYQPPAPIPYNSYASPSARKSITIYDDPRYYDGPRMSRRYDRYRGGSGGDLVDLDVRPAIRDGGYRAPSRGRIYYDNRYV